MFHVVMRTQFVALWVQTRVLRGLKFLSAPALHKLNLHPHEFNKSCSLLQTSNPARPVSVPAPITVFLGKSLKTHAMCFIASTVLKILSK